MYRFNFLTTQYSLHIKMHVQKLTSLSKILRSTKEPVKLELARIKIIYIHPEVNRTFKNPVLSKLLEKSRKEPKPNISRSLEIDKC